MKRLLFSRGFLLLLGLLVLGAGGLAAFWLVGPAIGTPQERLRVRHPAGFSVIGPKGWDPDVYYASGERGPGISFNPLEHKGMQPVFVVVQLPNPPDLAALREDGFTDTTFQKQPALQREREKRKLFYHSTVFSRGMQWYEITIGAAVPDPIGHGPWGPFRESFRTERAVDLHRAVPPVAATTTAP